MKAKDLVGQKFGRLTVVERAPNKGSKAAWKCICDCGGSTVAISHDLICGHTKSCGCYQRQQTSRASMKHGKRHTKIYAVWLSMKDRCFNHKNKRFEDYGGRGITVCDEWKNDKKQFFKWAFENGYADNLTIDRIDVKRGYSPENCRWVDQQTQQNNRSNNHILTINGISHTISEWARISGIKAGTIQNRAAHGWTGERLIT